MNRGRSTSALFTSQQWRAAVNELYDAGEDHLIAVVGARRLEVVSNDELLASVLAGPRPVAELLRQDRAAAKLWLGVLT